MTLPTLPEGARLALLNWPGGQPTVAEIVVAIASARKEALPPAWKQFAMIDQLLAAGMVEEVICEPPMRFRLTQPGRKAVDVLQSGVE